MHASIRNIQTGSQISDDFIRGVSEISSFAGLSLAFWKQMLHHKKQGVRPFKNVCFIIKTRCLSIWKQMCIIKNKVPGAKIWQAIWQFVLYVGLHPSTWSVAGLRNEFIRNIHSYNLLCTLDCWTTKIAFQIPEWSSKILWTLLGSEQKDLVSETKVQVQHKALIPH